jgi:hypothetical protein
VLVNRNPRFDLVINHYRAFNLETGPASGMDLMVHPAAQSRFSTFLDLIQGLDAANCDTVLVVNHGLSDRDSGRPLGLVLPLTANTPRWNPEEYTLGLLSRFIGGIPDEATCKKAEQDSIMDGVAMPAGTLRPLAAALQNLRLKRRLKRLELRACNLGGNEDVMKSLGMVLGVQTVVAPKVHMFYLGVTAPLPLPFSDAGFATWLTGHAHARTFTEVAANPGRVAIQVNGTGAFRSMDIATTLVRGKIYLSRQRLYFHRSGQPGPRRALHFFGHGL